MYFFGFLPPTNEIMKKNMEIQRKLLKNSHLDVKTYFYFLREDGFDIKIY